MDRTSAGSFGRLTSAFRDSQPGKVMHETRGGEMAALKEIPFGLYYGGVDTTPLFIVLAGAYADRTGDLAFIDRLWPALLAAMSWIEDGGDSIRLEDFKAGETISIHGSLTGTTLTASRIAKWS